MTDPHNYLTQFWAEKNPHTLEFWQSKGGYEFAKKAMEMEPKALIDLVKASGLRGRGGAGFPTGMKWSFVPQKEGQQRYISVNADESEPGTFKDRYLMELTPHQMIEGIIICAWAIQASTAFIYIRGEFPFQYKRVMEALAEAKKAGILEGGTTLGKNFPLKILVMRGAGAYICGEETAQLTSIEGNRGNPRLKPPFPAVVGLFGCPTVINNVETLSNLPWILKNGNDWYRQWGTEKAPGSRIFSVSGHVNKPGLYELPMNVPFKEVLEKHSGGMKGGRKLKAVVPGGSSAPLMTADEMLPINMDPESLQAAKTMMGSSAIVIMDETTDMVRVAYNLAKFYHHESCGQCTPCREGTGWLEKIVARNYHGGGKESDLSLIDQVGGQMCGRTICVLAEAAAWPLQSIVRKWPDDFRKRFGKQFDAHVAERVAEPAHA
ncbi:MAG: NADH-quinone oxidoreductase subunit NuoF [Planctomycetes bacterium]|nr:NADH-quinone oxidoreductase subunit NuoF [Planctomycetota bacterium]